MFLNTKGFFIGVPLAWGITVFEITGGATMALGLYVQWIAVVFMIELIMGIFLVHLPNGDLSSSLRKTRGCQLSIFKVSLLPSVV